jgi:hypothetical protein
MKSIVYLLVVVLFSSFIIAALPHAISNQKQIIKIESVEHVGSGLLDESCIIIKKRLKDYGLQNFDVSVNNNQKNIDITFNDNVDVNEILPLLISKGKIALYETYNRSDVINLLEKWDILFSILNIPSDNAELSISSAILGYCKSQNKTQVDSYLAKHDFSRPGQGINCLWSEKPNKNGDYYLYLLKHDPALDKTHILGSVESNTNNNTELMVVFNESGTLAWQELSKNNIGKPIALVIDNLVYFDPILKDEIKEGKCVISGNFTLKEIKQIKSLINNDELLVEFNLVK